MEFLGRGQAWGRYERKCWGFAMLRIRNLVAVYRWGNWRSGAGNPFLKPRVRLLYDAPLKVFSRVVANVPVHVLAAEKKLPVALMGVVCFRAPRCSSHLCLVESAMAPQCRERFCLVASAMAPQCSERFCLVASAMAPQCRKRSDSHLCLVKSDRP